jgi:hypothetical protein
MPRRKYQADGYQTAVTDIPAGDPNDANNLEEKTPPAHTVRIRNVRAAIWENARPDGTVWYSSTFSRTYRSADGKWHSTESFGGNDLLTLAEVARAAFLWMEAATQGGELPY